ncbi:hypothetical protein FQN54_004472 [Arachnomyces sp. PD_36]|nr:hypothetical protein FQN54_004472 [Arachnomyces sp. PD_36]
MDMESVQTPLIYKPPSDTNDKISWRSCHPIWDSDNARFSPCAEPYLAAIPAIFILLIASYYLLNYLVPRWRPKWMRPFVVEPISHSSELPIEGGKSTFPWTIVLVLLSVLGLAAEVTHWFFPPVSLAAAIQPFSWVIASVSILIKHPRTCPVLLVPYFLSVFILKLLFVLNEDNYSIPVLRIVAVYVSLAAAGASCCVILLMPFRPSFANPADISPVGQQPDRGSRSPEDNLRLWQFLSVSWMAPLIKVGKERQLNESDVWFLPYQFQHQRLNERFRQLRGSVLRRLLRANGIDVLIISSIAIVQLVCDFSAPVLLQKLLEATKDPTIPKRVPLTYALLTMVMRFITAQSQVLNLWYGRRAYERSRGEMVMMIYEKTLSRKNVFGKGTHDGSSESGDEDENANGEGDQENGPSRKKKARSWYSFWRRGASRGAVQAKEPASMGKILNLLRGDAYEVSQRFWEIDTLIDKPLGLIIAIALVWNLLGPSCLLGVVTVLLAQVLNALITSILLRWEKVRRVATDLRLQITSQFIEAIRHLRWYGWQDHWLDQVSDARKHELRLRIITSMWGIAIRIVNSFASGLFPVVALYAYTVLAKKPLSIDIIFPALQLFTKLELRLRDLPSLITTLINASVAMGRIEDFMSEPDKPTDAIKSCVDSGPIELESCSYAWPGTQAPALFDLNITIPKGLTVISGKVGAGKTALLQALLGELDKIEGASHIPNEMIGYCAQTPWLQSMSIRDNILFSSPYDERRYKKVLKACSLVQDLTNFKHGDLTFIGENGIGLSGGQKARVALARAVYSTARILLLDDPLSALDFNTAESVVNDCLSGSLMKDRTVVLVTHRTTLVHDIAYQIINIDKGRATVYDRDNISLADSGDVSQTPNPRNDDLDPEEDERLLGEESDAVPEKFIEEEARVKGEVRAGVYWSYIKAGKLKWWITLVIILAVFRLTTVALSWFLKDWGESYETGHVLFSYATSNRDIPNSNWLRSLSREGSYTASSSPISKLPAPADDVGPWLWVFLGITLFQTVNLLAAFLLMVVIAYFAGKTMFEQVMVRVSSATFRYFDVTPVGRLMNRLTSDIGVVDSNISQQFQNMSFLVITWITSVVVIASVTPTFLVFSLALTGIFVYVFLQFLPASQSLRRLEMVSLSPLLSNFGELLHGLTTVRAFHAETRFQNRVIGVVDNFQGMDHFYWSLQSWLMYRFESLSATSIFLLTVLALYTGVSAGMIAFVLIAADNFVTSTHGLCKQYGQIQMDFVSVERVEELRHIEQEDPGSIDPPAVWPTYGSDIIFEDVTVRYAPHLDPSLSNISLRIPGGSSTAVMGRTGSGKSTLALSLLKAVDADSGRIIIDGIDIAKVNTQTLRHRITFVAQEPVLFPGSIRLNLDPVDEYSDEECIDVLHRVCSDRHGWTLKTQVEAGGRNLSHGERQLIGLSRAVLRRSPIVILDEATASTDLETSLEIQQTIRDELKESTVVTIAHRLEAIKNANYSVVLDQGKIASQGYVDGE